MARICLVEDDLAVRRQLKLLLEHAGHEVAALERFDRLPQDILILEPDAAILDLGLPGTDGQYVARALRQESQVPLMVLTSRTSELDELMALTMGADDFVRSRPILSCCLLTSMPCFAAARRRSRHSPSRGSRWMLCAPRQAMRAGPPIFRETSSASSSSS